MGGKNWVSSIVAVIFLLALNIRPAHAVWDTAQEILEGDPDTAPIVDAIEDIGDQNLQDNITAELGENPEMADTIVQMPSASTDLIVNNLEILQSSEAVELLGDNPAVVTNNNTNLIEVLKTPEVADAYGDNTVGKKVFEAMVPDSSSALSNILDDLTASQTRDFLTSASPNSVGPGANAGNNAAASANNSSVQTRIAALHSETLYAKLHEGPAGPAGPIDDDSTRIQPGVWGSYIGTFGDQDPIDGINGFDYDTNGVMFGWDAKVCDTYLIGVNSGYSKTTVESGVATDTDIKNFNVGIYASQAFPNNSFYIDYGFAYNNGAIDSVRTITAGTTVLTATSTTDSNNYSVYVMGAYDIVAGKFIVTPIFGVQYSLSITDGYSEIGGGNLGLVVDENEANLFNTTFGVKSEIHVSDSIFFKIRTSWVHEWSNDLQSVTKARFAGSPTGSQFFETKGIDVGDDKFTVGTGVKFYPYVNFGIDVDYDLELGEEFLSHTGSASMKILF